MKVIEKTKEFIEKHPVATAVVATTIGIAGGYYLNAKIHMEERNSWSKFIDDTNAAGFDLKKGGIFTVFDDIVDESWVDNECPKRLGAKIGDTLNVLEVVYKKD